jgi:hypothetical protein
MCTGGERDPPDRITWFLGVNEEANEEYRNREIIHSPKNKKGRETGCTIP